MIIKIRMPSWWPEKTFCDQNGTVMSIKYQRQEGVFKAVKTAVVLGKSSGDFTEIVEGITAEDQIIEEGLRLVEDQQLVKIIQ